MFVTDKTNEYIESQGGVTTEFATTPAKLEEIKDSLLQESERLASLGARWIVVECSTCTEYHGEDYTLHASIETFEFCPATGGLPFDAADFQSIDDRRGFLTRLGSQRTIEQETELALIDDLDDFFN